MSEQEGVQYNQPVHLGDADARLRAGLSARLARKDDRPTISEADFMPQNVIPLEQEARDQRKLARLAQNPTRVVVKGGKRVVAVKVKIPYDQYRGLQRFEGETDAQKVLTILRMANRRVDEVQRQGAEAMAAAQESVDPEPAA